METRVERYRKLREEIQAMSGTEVTTATKTSQVVDKILDEKDKKELSKMDTSNLNISYKEIMDAYNIYEKDHPEEKEEFHLEDKRGKIFLISGIVLITLLSIALIIIGIIIWR